MESFPTFSWNFYASFSSFPIPFGKKIELATYLIWADISRRIIM